MLSIIQKKIIIRALQIRQKNGEDPTKSVKDYNRLTDSEKDELINALKQSDF